MPGLPKLVRMELLKLNTTNPAKLRARKRQLQQRVNDVLRNLDRLERDTKGAQQKYDELIGKLAVVEGALAYHETGDSG